MGVLFIIQPQAEGFDGYALVCLLSTVLLSVRDLVTRRVHAARPVDPGHAVEHDRRHAVRGRAVGLRRLAGVQRATRSATSPSSRSSCRPRITSSWSARGTATCRSSRRSAIPRSCSRPSPGFVIWGDTPNALAWGGIALVIASGIYVLRVSRRARAVTHHAGLTRAGRA